MTTPKAWLDQLHRLSEESIIKELLAPRIMAVASITLAKRVPLEVRVHILGVVTQTVTQHEGVSPDEAAELVGMLRSLLLPEKTQGWAKALLQDEVVQRVLSAEDEYYDRTLGLIQSRLKEDKEKLS